MLQTCNTSPVANALHSLWPRPHDPTTRDRRLVTTIRARAEQLRQRSGKELGDLTDQLREQAAHETSPTLPSILVPAFALVCEAARRTLGIDYYDVQLLAGLALSRHAIAEAQTGEGKTLVAALPALLFALKRVASMEDGREYVEQTEYVVRRCRQLGITCRLFVMTGLPGQDKAMLDETAGFLKKLRPDALHIKPYHWYPRVALEREPDEGEQQAKRHKRI